MTDDTARIIASCLDAIEQHGRTLDECVAQHPDLRVTLSELLPVAQTLQSAPAVMPSLDFRMDARQQLLARLPERHSQRAEWARKRAMSLRMGLMLVLAVVLATRVVTASAQALPNDMLYPVKRAIEHVRLAAADRMRGGDLHLTFAAERLAEVERLIDMGRGDEASVAIEDFATQMQSVVSIAQTMPDATERAALMARVAESIKSSDAVLSTSQARLPESAQVAVTRARALLAERGHDLHNLPPSTTPMMAASAAPNRAPDRQSAPSLRGTSPTAMPELSSAQPSNQPLHAASITPVVPNSVPSGVKPSTLRTVIPMFEPPQYPTPIPCVVGSRSGLHR